MKSVFRLTARFLYANALPRDLFTTKVSPTRARELFAKYVRLSEERGFAQQPITISEMLPAIDQAWLPDAEGNLYTSEFRIISVDQGSKPAVS